MTGGGADARTARTQEMREDMRRSGTKGQQRASQVHREVERGKRKGKTKNTRIREIQGKHSTQIWQESLAKANAFTE